MVVVVERRKEGMVGSNIGKEAAKGELLKST